MMRPWQRTTLAVLEVLPIPGVGGLIVGTTNPHTGLVRNGTFQLALFVLGAYPLIVPGAIAMGWAGWDAWRIWKAPLRPLPPKEDVPPLAPARRWP